MDRDIQRIESKVDAMADQLSRLNDAVIQMTRIEEQNHSIKKDLDGYGMRLTKVEDKINNLQTITAINKSEGNRTERWLERLIWFLVSAALAILYKFKH